MAGAKPDPADSPLFTALADGLGKSRSEIAQALRESGPPMGGIGGPGGPPPIGIDGPGGGPNVLGATFAPARVPG